MLNKILSSEFRVTYFVNFKQDKVEVSKVPNYHIIVLYASL